MVGGRSQGAVTSLLELTCDAVLELDAAPRASKSFLAASSGRKVVQEMKLTSHSQTLAAMLLHSPGSSLQGPELGNLGRSVRADLYGSGGSQRGHTRFGAAI